MNLSLTNPSLKFIPLCIRTLAGLLALSSALVHALPNDKNEALHISADKQEVNLKLGEVVYIGDVKLVQGSLEITSQKLTVHKDKNQTEESVTAEGSPAHYKQLPEVGKPEIHAEAGIIFYNFKTEQLELNKNVSIEQNGSISKADHVDYDIKSQTAKFSGNNRVETVIPAKTEKKE